MDRIASYILAVVQIRIGGEVVTLSWEQWEQRVRTGQIGDDTEVQFEPVTGETWVLARDLEMFHSLKQTAVLAFQGAGDAPIMTALLVGLNIRIWWAQLWVIPARDVLLGQCLAAHSPIMEDSQGWRLITSGFCHTDFLHITSNLVWLVVAGWGIERALGRLNVLLIFVASVLGGSLLSVLFTPETSVLGASGGVFGLIAAVVIFGFIRPHLLPENRRGLYGIAMLPYLVIYFLVGLTSDTVANWAHFGGMITGGALALVLDPPSLQRRAGWNAGWQWLVGAVVAVSLLAPLIAGPRLHVLVDAREARVQQTRTAAQNPGDKKPERYRPLIFRVPAGWAPRTNSSGDPAFLSRVWDAHRSWSVATRTESKPSTPEDVLERWRQRLERGWPNAVWSETEPRTVAGWPGLAVSVHIDEGDDRRVLEWWGVTRGIHSLQAVWEVEDTSARRLRPLRNRLYATIVWDDPEGLHDAQREITHRPRSRSARELMAQAVAEVGDADQAIEIWLGLIEDEPDKQDYWDGLLKTLEWYPQHPRAMSLWARALADRSSPRTTAAVANCLDAAGRIVAANGLIDLAWANNPGDRHLKRARRGRDQSTALDVETNRPWERVNDPSTGERISFESGPESGPETLNLELAHRRGIELAARAAQIEDAAVFWIEHPDTEIVPVSLLFMRFGEVPSELPEAYEALAKDVERLDGATPSWLPDRVATSARAEPGLRDRLLKLSSGK